MREYRRDWLLIRDRDWLTRILGHQGDMRRIALMSRAIRRVPPEWAHPKDKNGEYIPLRSGADYALDAGLWDEEAAKWQEGLCRTTPTEKWRPIDADLKGKTYTQEEGPSPRFEGIHAKMACLSVHPLADV
jgi:hypothetical protein